MNEILTIRIVEKSDASCAILQYHGIPALICLDRAAIFKM